MTRARVHAGVGLVVLPALALHAAPADDAGAAMATAANRFVASLDEGQKKLVMLSFDDPRRTQWHYFPKAERKGLQLRDMNAEQKTLALALLASGLSETGYRKAVVTMDLEKIIDKFEDSTTLRDPLRYFFTVFGTPAAKGKWGLSVEGHHVSLNYVVLDGKVVAATPMFFGANPAEVKQNGEVGPSIGTRNLGDSEKLAYDLLAGCTPEQRKKAVLAEKITGDMNEGHKPQTDPVAPRGLPASEMTDAQKKTLRKLIESYVRNLPAEFAEPYLKKMDDAGFEKIHFAWFGSDKPGVDHTYEVRGPTLLILLNNTQADPTMNPANHIHSLLRFPEHDFGN